MADNHSIYGREKERGLNRTKMMLRLTRVSSVFSENDEISDIIRSACFHQLLQLIFTSVDALGIGEDELHLLS
jgi:hypothetical protein